MRIIGVDPGIGRCGWGIIEIGPGHDPKVIEYGCIETEKKDELSTRLLELHTLLTRYFEEFRPDVLALETLFFNQNVKTAMVVGRASGVVILVASQYEIPVVEYTPTQIKSAIAGYGSAGKSQMEAMITRLLNLPEVPSPDDTADALAIALCHAVSIPRN